MVSTSRRWSGRLIAGAAVLFLAFDTAIKLLQIEPVRRSLIELGYPVNLGLTIGLIELVCLTVYLVPATAVAGATLLTGYLGGAVATHVRAESPLLTHIMFPFYVGAMIWGGLLLQRPDVVDFLKPRSTPNQRTGLDNIR